MFCVFLCLHVYSRWLLFLRIESGRPIFSPSRAAADEKEAVRKKAEEDAAERALVEEDKKRQQRIQSPLELHEKAPRDESGELILRRREIHSGRAISVSAVEWSVAEKTATPTSVLEGFMWDKETEVDRFRERVPLSNLVSQCRLSAMDPSMAKPRDWASSIRLAISADGFAVLPECKRIDPASGSLRKRYDLSKLAKQFTVAGAPAISVNCDGVLFGGSLDDLKKAREASGSAAVEMSDSEGVVVPPILASDLILYPYQLYQLRLAGADAVNLMTGALARKDLRYLTKIASSLQLQTLATVTSEVQIKDVADLSKGSISGLIISNRELEDFSFDMSGEQALSLLHSDALKEFRNKHGDDVPVLVEGRVGIIEIADESGNTSTGIISKHSKRLVRQEPS
jgi:indole-3-glycerol phosphate synthase